MKFNKEQVSKPAVTYPNSHPRLPHETDWSGRQVALVIGAVTAAAVTPGLFAFTALAQTLFPDVAPDYWAQPFIEKLAQQDIVEGYPDGTFRPEETIDRDEYAAIIRKAFDANTERALESASTLSDVPENYWAAQAIEEAYETGFMGLPDTNGFNPQAELSRADAITALVQGLEPFESVPVAATPTAVTTTTTQPEPQAAQAQRGTPFFLAIPMASTELMRAFAPPAPTPTPAPTAQVESAPTSAETVAAAAVDLSAYYADADQIPDYARDEIAKATRLGLIVNYPNVNLLNPTAPISRGGAAALIHQTLVYQDKLEPLPEASLGFPYVVPAEPSQQ